MMVLFHFLGHCLMRRDGYGGSAPNLMIEIGSLWAMIPRDTLMLAMFEKVLVDAGG